MIKRGPKGVFMPQIGSYQLLDGYLRIFLQAHILASDDDSQVLWQWILASNNCRNSLSGDVGGRSFHTNYELSGHRFLGFGYSHQCYMFVNSLLPSRMLCNKKCYLRIIQTAMSCKKPFLNLYWTHQQREWYQENSVEVRCLYTAWDILFTPNNVVFRLCPCLHFDKS